MAIKKSFTDIENTGEIDFSSADWSWSFGPDDYKGCIRHTVFDDSSDTGCITTEYRIPLWMEEIICQVRNIALHNLKESIRALDMQKKELLKT